MTMGAGIEPPYRRGFRYLKEAEEHRKEKAVWFAVVVGLLVIAGWCFYGVFFTE